MVFCISPWRSRGEPNVPRRRHALIRSVVVSALLCGGATRVFALDADVIVIDLTASHRYDTNLYSLADFASPPGNGSRSATTQTTGATFRIDKPYALQRFDAYANIAHVHYAPYSNLDLTSHAYGLAWAWTLTPSLTGNLSIDESRTPNSFSDTGFQTSPNPRTTENRRFDVNFRPGAAIHPRFAIYRTSDKSEQTTIERQNAETTSLEAAIVYDFRSSNTAEVYFRRGRGRYFDLDLDPTSMLDSKFDEREVGVGIHWQASGSSRFEGRVGHLVRTHLEFGQRNFSGTVAQVDYNYVYSGKSRLQLSASRQLTASETSFSNYLQTETLLVSPVWAATGKITVRPSYSISRRDFRGAPTPGADRLQTTQRDLAMYVDWAALRSITISGNVFRSDRRSSDPNFRYVNRGYMATGSLHF